MTRREPSPAGQWGYPAGDRAMVMRRGTGTAQDAARFLADWFAELGYLEHADAVQIVSDEFGEAFVRVNTCGRRDMRPDVLKALRVLIPRAAWRYFRSWPELGQSEQPVRRNANQRDVMMGVQPLSTEQSAESH